MGLPQRIACGDTARPSLVVVDLRALGKREHAFRSRRVPECEHAFRRAASRSVSAPASLIGGPFESSVAATTTWECGSGVAPSGALERVNGMESTPPRGLLGHLARNVAGPYRAIGDYAVEHPNTAALVAGVAVIGALIVGRGPAGLPMLAPPLILPALGALAADALVALKGRGTWASADPLARTTGKVLFGACFLPILMVPSLVVGGPEYRAGSEAGSNANGAARLIGAGPNTVTSPSRPSTRALDPGFCAVK